MFGVRLHKVMHLIWHGNGDESEMACPLHSSQQDTAHLERLGSRIMRKRRARVLNATPGTLSEDETVRSLRRVRDRHFHRASASYVLEWPESIPRDLVREIVRSLPDGIFYRVADATSRADGHHLSVRISSLFDLYVTLAAEYWSGLFLGHGKPPSGKPSKVTSP
jgi:hypothetical protein